MTPQRRNPRASVEDRWKRRDGSPSAKAGQGKRWRARWVQPDGTERERLFDRKVDAQLHLDGVSASMHRGDYVAPEGPATPLRMVAERYFSGLDVKPSTAAGYRSILDRHVLPKWGATPLRGITPSGVRAWLGDLQRGEKAVSSGYARQCGRVLSMVLDVAVGDKLIPRSPMESVKLPRANQPRQGNSLTAEQLAHVIREMPTESDRTLTAVLAYTGVRWGEAVALRVESVDFQRNRISVTRTYVELGGRVEAGTPKNQERRTVPAPPFLMTLLREAAAGKGSDEDLFTSRAGGPLRGTNWLRRVYRPALLRAKVPGPDERKIHDLRHTYASLAVQAGANIKQLQRAMGHASATMTLDVYADLFDEDFSGLGTQLEPTAGQLRAMKPADIANP